MFFLKHNELYKNTYNNVFYLQFRRPFQQYLSTFNNHITVSVDFITAVLLHGRSICLPRGVKSCLRPVYLFQPSSQRPNSLHGGLQTATPPAPHHTIFLKLKTSIQNPHTNNEIVEWNFTLFAYSKIGKRLQWEQWRNAHG